MERVVVVYHSDSGAWWADSPSVAGWTAAADTLDELRRLVEEGVRFALERDDVIIEHVFEHGVFAYSDVVYDFVSGQTVSRPAIRVGGDAGREAAAAQFQPA